MQLKDLLDLLREEFLIDLPQAQTAMRAWQNAPAHGQDHAQVLCDLMDRLVRGAQVVNLQGLISYLGIVRECAIAALATPTPSHLNWLAQWHLPVQTYLRQPGSLAATSQISNHLQTCPLPQDPHAIALLAELLDMPPSMPADEGQSEGLAAAQPEDVSLATDDVDPGLLSALLADAPDQLERVATVVESLRTGAARTPQLQEAQRITHTLKGSGAIVGLPGIGRFAHRLEDLMEYALDCVGQQTQIPLAMASAMADAVMELQHMIGYLQGEDAAPAQQHSLAVLQSLIDWVQAVHDGQVPGDGQLATPQARPAPPATHDAALPPLQSALPSSSPVSMPTDPMPVFSAVEPLEPAPTHAAQATAAIGNGIEVQLTQKTVVAAPVASSEHAQVEPTIQAAPADTAMLRVAAERMTKLVRAAGQSMVGMQRLNQLLSDASDRLSDIERRHSELTARIRALDDAVGKQVVALRAHNDGLDPLELDRYDALYIQVRTITEAVEDEFELARQAHVETKRALSVIRTETYAHRDQHQHLLDARLVPVKSIVPRLRRNVMQTAATTGKQAQLKVVGEHITMDTDVLTRLTEPLLHILRNAVDHGIETPQQRHQAGKPLHGQVLLEFSRVGRDVQVLCSDDGAGLDLAAIRSKAVEYGLVSPHQVLSDAEIRQLIFHPGLSTRTEITEVSGRGVGMDVVQDRITALKGRITLDSEPGKGTRLTLRVPVSIGSTQALVVRCQDELLAIPSDQVLGITTKEVELSPMAESGGWQVATGSGTHPYFELGLWLGFLEQGDPSTFTAKPCVITQGPQGSFALGVDAVVDTRELILQDIGPLVRRVCGASSAALRPDGRPLLLLDLLALERSSRSVRPVTSSALLRKRLQAQRTRLLVVDDALSVRRSMQQLLEDAGYEVTVAVDGFDALEKLPLVKPMVVLTDLEMPNLNGLELTVRMRAQESSKRIPILMITSRSSAKHKAMADEAGVNVYLTKPFQDHDLLQLVRDLVTRARANNQS